MRFFNFLGNLFKKLWDGICWVFKHLWMWIVAGSSFLFNTVAGRIISSLIGTILTLFILYYFIKYGLPILGKAVFKW